MAIIITADSSCDLPKDFLGELHFELFPLTIIQNGLEYKDGVEITPEIIYQRVDAGVDVPTTSAVNIVDYAKRFTQLSALYEAVIHISISSKLSSCYQNACLAAEAFDNVYIVDSLNISCGQAILVLEAARMAKEGLPPAQIAARLTELRERVEFTFILDQVTYLHKGGRCSGIAALGANLLRLKPVIATVNGQLEMVRKYQGSFEKVLPMFFRNLLKDRGDLDHEKTMLITTHCPSHWVELAKSEIALCAGRQLEEVFTAGCTICSHSGPKALGIAVLRRG